MRELLDPLLAKRTTFEIGGPARRLLEIFDEAEVHAAMRSCQTAGEPWMVLGGGSNVLVADEGWPGAVLQVCLREQRRTERADGVVELTVGAGVIWDELVASCVDEGLSGIECLSGIPGWVGAAPVQNIGAYGSELSDCLSGVRVYDVATGAIEELPATACALGYRDSIFKHGAAGRYIIVAAHLMLHKRPPAIPAHPELRRALGATAVDSVEPARLREAVLAIRRSKSMVVDPADPDSHGAGSFFVNPIVTAAEANSLRTRADQLLGDGAGANLPAYALPDKRVKLSAAWLIEHAGFPRGYGHGPIRISRKHTLAIVNHGGGTATAVVALATEIQRGVQERFGVHLIPEPKMIGDADTLHNASARVGARTSQPTGIK